MAKNTKAPASGTVITPIPMHKIPFVALAVRRHRGNIEVYMKTQPRRPWKPMLRGPLSILHTTLPRA